MAGELQGKVIVLTGGGEGIGAECARAYVREGASVAILDRNLEAAENIARRAGENCVAISADVSDGHMVEAAIIKVLDRFGRIDAVHNNAGDRVAVAAIARNQRGRLGPSSARQREIGLLDDTFCLPGTRGIKRRHSEYGKHGGANRSDQPCSLCREQGRDDLAHESDGRRLRPPSIRVNAICPAGVWTPTLERWCAEQPNAPEMREYLDAIHLLGPCPHGDVIADVAVFLLSHRARFMTGCIVPVSGGAELGYRR